MELDAALYAGGTPRRVKGGAAAGGCSRRSAGPSWSRWGARRRHGRGQARPSHESALSVRQQEDARQKQPRTHGVGEPVDDDKVPDEDAPLSSLHADDGKARRAQRGGHGGPRSRRVAPAHVLGRRRDEDKVRRKAGLVRCPGRATAGAGNPQGRRRGKPDAGRRDEGGDPNLLVAFPGTLGAPDGALSTFGEGGTDFRRLQRQRQRGFRRRRG